MSLARDEEVRIGGRLKNALISDLVMEDLTPSGDEILMRPLRHPHDWTRHLARQLRIDMDADWRDRGELHETLLFIVLELEAAMRQWPPPRDLEWCRSVARAATVGMTVVEIVATLSLGPAEWQRSRLAEGTVGDLRHRSQIVLEERLAAELHTVLTRWVETDIRQLQARRAKVIEQQERRQRAEAAPPPRPLGSSRNRDRDPRPYYQPPPRA